MALGGLRNRVRHILTSSRALRLQTVMTVDTPRYLLLVS